MSPSSMRVTPLGAGCEVGRSCIVVEFRGRCIMFDCGIHPAHSGIGALPVFDAVDVSKVDLCLVTHFHLDHCGALPYLVAKTNFRGRVLMTEPTRAVAKLLWVDYASMAKASSAEDSRQGKFHSATEYAGGGILPSNVTDATRQTADNTEQSTLNSGGPLILFDALDVDKALKKIETISFHQTKDFSNMRVTAYAAGHVLGACMFSVEIDGIRILYTGDYSREIDRHVPIAEVPKLPIHVLICESTYGIRIHEPRHQREARFLESVTRIVKRGGKCLLPVFALGRAQELLLMLEEHWTKTPSLHNVPIWYASPMSSKSMVIFETFINVCGKHAQDIADTGRNPFEFQYVKTARRLADMEQDTKGGPCVVMAAPGMLQSGTSRALFEMWCGDRRNGVVLTGYTLKGTLAHELKSDPTRLLLGAAKVPTKIESSFEMISFSAHSDFEQTFSFVKAVQANIIVLVHGERTEVNRLASKLKELRNELTIFCPEILQTIDLQMSSSEREVVLLGSLAKKVSKQFESGGSVKMSALAVGPKETPKLLSSTEEVSEYFDHIATGSVFETLVIDVPYDSLQFLEKRISAMFCNTRLVNDTHLMVGELVELSLFKKPEIKENEMSHCLLLEWDSAKMGSQVIADAVAVAAQECISSQEGSTTDESITEQENKLLSVVVTFLQDTYGYNNIFVSKENNEVLIRIQKKNGTSALINFGQRQIKAETEEDENTIRQLLRKIETSVLPLMSSFFDD